MLFELKFITDLEWKMVSLSGNVLNLLHYWTYGTGSNTFSMNSTFLHPDFPTFPTYRAKRPGSMVQPRKESLHQSNLERSHDHERKPGNFPIHTRHQYSSPPGGSRPSWAVRVCCLATADTSGDDNIGAHKCEPNDVPWIVELA